jgi:hypothetical protein
VSYVGEGSGILQCAGGGNFENYVLNFELKFCNRQRIYIFDVLWTLKKYCDSLLMIFLFYFVGH